VSIILSINEVHSDAEEGYEVVCDDQKIEVMIDAFQGCCEDWGYLSSEDDFSKFIGAGVVGVRVVDTELRTYDDIPDYETDIMFVNVDTTAGMLQFVLYNSHNGYYGHTARVSARGLDHSEVL
jgi:hypothetical protein